MLGVSVRRGDASAPVAAGFHVSCRPAKLLALLGLWPLRAERVATGTAAVPVLERVAGIVSGGRDGENFAESCLHLTEMHQK